MQSRLVHGRMGKTTYRREERGKEKEEEEEEERRGEESAKRFLWCVVERVSVWCPGSRPVRGVADDADSSFP